MRNRNGFTLIELLVVITIIVVLAGLLIPGVLRAMKQAKTNRALSEMQHLATVITQVYSEVGYYVRLEDLARTDGSTYVRRWIAADYTNGFSDGDISDANLLTAITGGLDVSTMWNGPYTTYKSFATSIPTNTVSPNSGYRPIDPWGMTGSSNADTHQYRMFWITDSGAAASVVPAGAHGAMVIISAGGDGKYQCSIAANKTPANAVQSDFNTFNPLSIDKGDDVYYIFNAGIQ